MPTLASVTTWSAYGGRKAFAAATIAGALAISMTANPVRAREDLSTGNLAGDTIPDQTRRALWNCEPILRAGGAKLDDVAEVGVLLADSSGPPYAICRDTRVDVAGLLVSNRMTACTDSRA